MLTEIEKKLKRLEERIEALETPGENWQKLNKASQILGISTDTIRRRIKENSKFKKGIHWRKIGNAYQINVNTWTKREGQP
jgi:hypothetical protein